MCGTVNVLEWTEGNCVPQNGKALRVQRYPRLRLSQEDIKIVLTFRESLGEKPINRNVIANKKSAHTKLTSGSVAILY
ncbi:hypothetical protein CMUST_02885 [Corynebacterium mustelae]|uniref:Uncharacterized protein n=1 Tax=Corynebacterium mustelae TaxID=571915 RepID=A0A0G3GUR4_9CORY|nr:hypothetical protein CMUST_02885 [Corynebacterium mustelae]